MWHRERMCSFSDSVISLPCMCHILFICLSVNEHLSHPHLLPTLNSATMNICEQGFVWVPVFTHLVYTQVEFLGYTVILYFFKKIQTFFFFLQWLQHFYSNQQCMGAPILPHPWQHLFSISLNESHFSGYTLTAH